MALEIPSMDEIIHGTLLRTHGPSPTWAPNEVAAVRAARNALQMLSSASPARALFDAIRHCLPFAGGLVEVINSALPTELLHVVHDVPDSFLSSRAQHIADDLAVPFGIRIPVGVAARGVDGLPGRLFMAPTFNQIMYPHHGFDHVSGMKITRAVRGGDENTEILWMFTENNARIPTWRETRLLELVHLDIQQAIHRMRIPLLPHEPIRYQVMLEQCIGYMLIGAGNAIREANRRAVHFANEYTPATTPSRTRLAEFFLKISATPPSGQGPFRYLRGPSEARFLGVAMHRLRKEVHAIDEDLVLIEMREVQFPEGSSGASMAQIESLSPRQREVAMLLVNSGMSYKQIADALGISEGTVRKHAEHIYRALGVHSRSELIVLLHGRDRGFQPS